MRYVEIVSRTRVHIPAALDGFDDKLLLAIFRSPEDVRVFRIGQEVELRADYEELSVEVTRS